MVVLSQYIKKHNIKGKCFKEIELEEEFIKKLKIEKNIYLGQKLR